MHKLLKELSPVMLAIIVITTSCTNQKTTTEEKVEINTMDSSARKAKEVTDKLEEQTKQVEADIEKLDEENKTAN